MVIIPLKLKFLLYYYSKQEKKNKLNLSQTELDDMIAPQELDIRLGLSFALKVYILCLFYSFIFPIISLIGFLSLVVIYIRDKYLVLRIYRKPKYRFGIELIESL